MVGREQGARLRRGPVELGARWRRIPAHAPAQPGADAPQAGRGVARGPPVASPRRRPGRHRPSKPPAPVKIATWNVNSLRVRLPHLLPWLAAHAPDVMCLQETKCEDATFPGRGAGSRGLLRAAPRAAHLQRRGDPVAQRRRGRVPRHPRLRGSAEPRDRRRLRRRARGERLRAQRPERGHPTSTRTSCAGSRPSRGWLAAELARAPAPRGAGRLQRGPRGARRARSDGVGRAGALRASPSARRCAAWWTSASPMRSASSSSRRSRTPGGTTAWAPSAATWACASTTSLLSRGARAPLRFAAPSTPRRAASSGRATTRR